MTRIRCPYTLWPTVLSVLAPLVIACGGDDGTASDVLTASEVIGMRAETTQSITRAIGDGEFALDNEQLQQTGFGVYCWYTGNAPFTVPFGSPYVLLMRNQKVEHVATTTNPLTHWTYSPEKFWPLDDTEKLTLRAYAPYTPYMYTDNEGMPLLPVIVASTDYHDGTQHDPLFGTNEDGQLYDDMQRSQSDDNTVHWYFRHGMTKLLFKGLVSTDYTPSSPDYKLRITSIAIDPLYKEGLLDVSRSTAINNDDKPVWQQRSGDISVKLDEDDLLDVNLYNAANEYVSLTEHGLLIIPRDYHDLEQEMHITITYETENPATGPKTVSGTVTQHLHGNTVYTIQMLFNPRSNTVNIILAVDLNWQTGDYHLIDKL